MQSRKLFRQVLTLAMACVVALGAIGVLGGCAKSEEDQIRKITEKTFDTLKHPTADDLDPLIEGFGGNYSLLKTYGTDISEFLSHSNAKLEYNIDSIVIEGKKATASLTLTNVDIEAVAKEAQKDIVDHLDEYADTLASENGDVELVKLFVQRYYELIDASTDTTTSTCDLKFEKDDDEWVLSEESCQKLVEMPLGVVNL